MDSTSTDNHGAIGKRERFINLMKSTKASYLPAISHTLKQSTSTVWDHSKNAPPYHYKEFPSDMRLTYYPTYSTKKFNRYESRIRFSLQSPGNISSRRNRVLVMLSKQYIKSGSNVGTMTPNNSSTDFFDSDLNVIDSDEKVSDYLPSISRSDIESSIPNVTDTNELKVLKERMTGFITKSIGNVPLKITLSDNHNKLVQQLASDSKGFVDTKIQTEFLPTNINISLDHDQSLDFCMDMSENFTPSYFEPEGLAIISDIDDTIKHTGITGDKRSMFRNVFVHDIESWLIKDIPQWYNNLKSFYNSDFFYVSNSPMQLFSILNDYIGRYLPQGPLFLKQYSGNLLSGIMTSSANRKLNSLRAIFNDFPQKKFILIGDSGEQDLEAYITTALNYPDQVVAIYIRCCKNSMSDMGLNETEVMNELNNVIHNHYVKPFTDNTVQQVQEKEISPSPSTPTKSIFPRKKYTLSNSQLNLRKIAKLANNYTKGEDFGLCTSESSAPASPQSTSPPPAGGGLNRRETSTSPHNLNIHNTAPTMNLKKRPTPPTLPFSLEKPHTDSELIGLFNERNEIQSESNLNKNGNNNNNPEYMLPASQDDYNTYNGYFDKKADSWNKRVKQCIRQLIELDKYDLGLMFFTDPREAEKDSISRITDIRS